MHRMVFVLRSRIRQSGAGLGLRSLQPHYRHSAAYPLSKNIRIPDCNQDLSDTKTFDL
jgi:hypothetical protein